MSAIEDMKKKTDGMPDEVVITLTTQQAKALLDQLEAERQRADKNGKMLERVAGQRDQAFADIEKAETELAALKGEQVPVALTVWYGSMPESNGKENWTAILHRKGEGKLDGITIDRSEYPGRVLYAADRARYLIGEKQDRPNMLSYDSDKRSNYIYPVTAPQKPVVLPQATVHSFHGEPFYTKEQMQAAIEAAGGIVKDGE